MDISNLIGWVGNIAFIIGAYLIARKKISCFYMNGLGNVCYVTQGIMICMSSLVFISLFLLGLNFYGFCRWRRKDEKIDV